MNSTGTSMGLPRMKSWPFGVENIEMKPPLPMPPMQRVVRTSWSGAGAAPCQESVAVSRTLAVIWGDTGDDISVRLTVELSGAHADVWAWHFIFHASAPAIC